MNDVISQYQKWKQQGDELRAQAKQAMESRFRDLLSEAVRIAEEYRADFGGPLKPGAPVTAFRYKAPAKSKAKGKKSAPAKSAATKTVEPKPANAKFAGHHKRLATLKKKLDEAKAGGKATRPLEDKIYEIEDELRLAGEIQ